MADTTLRLQPCGKGAEYLKPIDLSLHSGRQELFILGRNLVTGNEGIGAAPNAQYLSRAHVQVQARGGKVFLRPLAREKNIIFLNGKGVSDEGEIEMKVQDKLSLLGSLECFNYQLIPCSPASSTPNPDPNLNTTIDLLNDTPDGVDKHKNKKQRVFQFHDDVVDLDCSPPTHTPISAYAPPSSLKRTSSSSLQPQGDVIVLDDVSPVSKREQSSVDNSPPVSCPPPVPASSSQPTAIPPAAADTPTTSSNVLANKPPTDFLKTLLRQYECSICFEPMACAVSLVPCGDTFCFACIADYVEAQKDKEKKCPHCQASGVDLSRALPSRLVEDSVRKLLEQMQDATVLKDWEARVKDGVQRRKAALGGASSSSSATAGAGGRHAPSSGSEVVELPRFPFVNNRSSNTNMASPAIRQAALLHQDWAGGVDIHAPSSSNVHSRVRTSQGAPRANAPVSLYHTLSASAPRSGHLDLGHWGPPPFNTANGPAPPRNAHTRPRNPTSSQKKPAASGQQVVDLTDSQNYESVFL